MQRGRGSENRGGDRGRRGGGGGGGGGYRGGSNRGGSNRGGGDGGNNRGWQPRGNSGRGGGSRGGGERSGGGGGGGERNIGMYRGRGDGMGFSSSTSSSSVGLPVTASWGRPRQLDDSSSSGVQTGSGSGSSTSLTAHSGHDIVRDFQDMQDVQEAIVTEMDQARGGVRGKRILPDVLQITRPQSCLNKQGTVGRSVTVQTNYFRLLKKPEWFIHQYRVDFAPEVDLLHVRRGMIGQHREMFGGYVFDGTMLFSTQNLKDKMVNDVHEIITKDKAENIVQIKIKHVGIVEATDMQQMQVLNLILRRSMEGLKLQQLNRNFFDPKAKIPIDNHRLEIWPGYVTSIRQHEKDVLMCAEIAHKVLRTDTVYNILTQLVKESSDYKNAFKAEVIGMVVITDYNNKTYRVNDVDFSLTPKSTFKQKDKEISFAEYYKQRYNLTIRDLNQPLLISKPTEKNIRGGQDDLITLVPELTRATGLNESMRSNFRLMKAMHEHTRLKPDRRIERLKVFNDRLQKCADSMNVMRSWDVALDRKLVEVPARILNPEKILFGNNSKYDCDDRADWSREFRSNQMYSQTDIKRWFVIVAGRNVRETQNFVKMCQRVGQGMKMHIAEPKYIEMRDDRNNSYASAIDVATSQDPQILMLVLFSPNEEKYSVIKKKCCVDRPVASQVVTMKIIAPRPEKSAGLMSIATKIVIQMNAKLRGIPWMIDMPNIGLMTCGFDVCHSTKNKSNSYGAFVATMDIRRSSRYFSSVQEHVKGQELSNYITLSVANALRAYKEEHNCLPERIVFYRDGVGDGQLHQVINHEVKSLVKRLEDMYGSVPPRFAFIIVSKRINTRYFINERNPPPGTIVDDILTLPERYDFYLVSQSVFQGTVSPTNYNVIYDSTGLKPEHIQMLSFKMTHMYYNWSGTCRVPAVCQYAHKLAFLVAESIMRAPSNALEKNLYFL